MAMAARSSRRDSRGAREARGAGGARVALLIALPFVLGLVADLAVYATVRDQLPDRLARHFGADGEADGYVGHGGFLVMLVGVFVVLGAAGVLFVLRSDLAAYRRGFRGLLAGAFATAAFLAWPMGASLVANRGTADGATAVFPLWHLAVAVAVAGLAAGAGAGLARFVPLPDVRAPLGTAGQGAADRLDLGRDEVAGWVRRTGSWVLSGTGIALAVAGIVTLWLLDDGWLTPLSLFVPGLLIAAFARACVTVDRRGLTVSPGMVPWPRIRLPLDRIERADARQINAFADYGGWGYRIVPGRSGVIMRSGEALVVRRANGKDFAVTVEDSATAAALLNTLVERAGHADHTGQADRMNRTDDGRR
ncbi:DUF1648 domain-containing protein [Streptomyces sp. NBC_01283]|uniref:DUF1648 domain-containing protein n=1 Tax=Streptomyces sp. NBC_01283 TaxID=2903812 RepID=UPI00352D6E8E|nr:DUF1648 domain-containing protein [Streptomyces sp. NBC_01283]